MGSDYESVEAESNVKVSELRGFWAQVRSIAGLGVLCKSTLF